MKSILKGLAVASLTAAVLASGPIFIPYLGNFARATIALQGPQTCTPDQLLGCVNNVINSVNNQTQTCVASGCAGTPTGAVPVITLTCATAGGASSSMLAGSNNDHGRVTCTSLSQAAVPAAMPAGKW